MDFPFSSKERDGNSWRTAEAFAASYRQALLDVATSWSCVNTESLFARTCDTIDSAIVTHQEIVSNLDRVLADIAAVPSALRLNELTGTFYRDLYRHFGLFRSAPAFYQQSMRFLGQASTALIRRTADQLNLSATDLPEIALIAVGPAGRCEYSPFCPLQILIVHGAATTSQLATIDRFSTALHGGFETAGLHVDPVVTPRNPLWRGTLEEWQQRSAIGLSPHTDEELINLCRLIDQYPLHSSGTLAHEFKQNCSGDLGDCRPALAHQIQRMTALSNGLGLLGWLKLERSGSERGMFRLLDHGLLPLSAALSALVLIKGSASVSIGDRVRDLLQRGELDARMAERIEETWHHLHELRLLGEQSLEGSSDDDHGVCLDPSKLTTEQLHSLKEALESIAVIQRHVASIFSGKEE